MLLWDDYAICVCLGAFGTDARFAMPQVFFVLLLEFFDVGDAHLRERKSTTTADQTDAAAAV